MGLNVVAAIIAINLICVIASCVEEPAHAPAENMAGYVELGRCTRAVKNGKIVPVERVIKPLEYGSGAIR